MGELPLLNHDLNPRNQEKLKSKGIRSATTTGFASHQPLSGRVETSVS